MNVSIPFQILKMDRRRGNIVVLRRAILEESRAEKKTSRNLAEGSCCKILLSMAALLIWRRSLHVTDMAWRRVNHPSELLNIGEIYY